MRLRSTHLVVSLVAIVFAGASLRAQSTQTPPQAQQQTTPPPSQASTDLPVNVDKIRQGLNRPQPIRFDASKIRFYLEVHAPPVTFTTLVGHFDLMKGPVPYATMTGREFMDMVTPREMYSEAGIKATDMLQFSLTNLAAQAIIRIGAEEIRKAKERHDEKQIADIQARIDREIAALMGKGGS